MRRGTIPTVLGAWGLAAVAAAHRPPLLRWPWSVATALPSAFVSEGPALTVGAHALGALAAGRATGLPRVAGIALNLAAAAGVASLLGDARRSRDALEDALAEAGVARPELPATAGAPARRRPGGVLGGLAARRRHRRVIDMGYGELRGEHGPFSTLDVWYRDDLPRDGRAPVLLAVHGGAWTTGNKTGQGEPLMAEMVDRGWVCVTVNYRLAPAARWPAMIVDVKSAIAWIRAHIAEHGGDPDFVAVTGGSAGGHLAALAALSANDPAYQPGFEDVDTTLAAAVPLYGVFDFTRDRQGLFRLLETTIIGTTFADDERTWHQASPVHRVGPGSPPFFLVHGSTDAIVGVEQSRRMAAALRERSGSPAGYAELPHAQHGFDALATARTRHTVRAAARFLEDAHRRHRAGRAAETGRKDVGVGR